MEPFSADVFTAILSLCEDDRGTINACSLVHRDWVAPAQRCIFRTVKFDGYSPNVHQRCQSMHEILFVSPHIARYIHRVHLRIDMLLTKNEAFQRLLMYFRDIRTLAIHGVTRFANKSVYWPNFPLGFLRSLTMLVSNSEFSTLSISDIAFSPSAIELAYFLRSCDRTLRHLSFCRIEYLKESPAVGASRNANKTPVALTGLNELNITGKLPEFCNISTIPNLHLASIGHTFDPTVLTILSSHPFLRYIHFKCELNRELYQWTNTIHDMIYERQFPQLEYISCLIDFIPYGFNWESLIADIHMLVSLGQFKRLQLVFVDSNNTFHGAHAGGDRHVYVRNFWENVWSQFQRSAVKDAVRLHILDGTEEDSRKREVGSFGYEHRLMERMVLGNL